MGWHAHCTRMVAADVHTLYARMYARPPKRPIANLHFSLPVQNQGIDSTDAANTSSLYKRIATSDRG